MGSCTLYILYVGRRSLFILCGISIVILLFLFDRFVWFFFCFIRNRQDVFCIREHFMKIHQKSRQLNGKNTTVT